jgi:amino acid adenylation domain-containing protein
VSTAHLGARPITWPDIIGQIPAERTAVTFLRHGEHEECALTYGALDRRARAISVVIGRHAQEDKRAILLYPPGVEFVAALLACLYCGVAAVPVAMTRHQRLRKLLPAIVRDVAPCLIVSARDTYVDLAKHGLPHAIAPVNWVITDDVPTALADDWIAPHIHPEQPALIQYTSGSTREPRGVVIRHRNLLHNQRTIRLAFRHSEESTFVSWLPIYHDMGLIGCVLQPLFIGASFYLMAPTAFIQKPLRWLAAISRYRARTSGGPSSAFDLCVRMTTPEERASLDLRSWDMAFNGAEPVHERTINSFTETFASCGFRREAFYPCYGLAEATLFVSGGHKNMAATTRRFSQLALETGRIEVDDRHGKPLVGCGQTWGGQEIAIVTADGARAAPGQVGEIWVQGQSVADQYWRRTLETEQTFNARIASTDEGPFLRTGDLGAVVDNELFVTGRLKDVIIIRGRNHYPQDIEFTASNCSALLRPEGAAAFVIEADADTRLVIVQELERHVGNELISDAVAAIRKAVAEAHDIAVSAIHLIRFGALPRTTSGKIQRALCRDKLAAGMLPVVSEWREGMPFAPGIAGPDVLPGRADVAGWLAQQILDRLQLPAGSVAPDQPALSFGLDSIGALEIVHRAERELGLEIPVEKLLDGTTRLADIPDCCKSSRAPARPAPSRQDVPVTSSRLALWLHNAKFASLPVYSLTRAFRIRTSVEAKALRNAISQLIARHPALRTVFPLVGMTPVARVLDPGDSVLREIDASGWSDERLRTELLEQSKATFDLERGPLIRSSLFVRPNDPTILVISIHHLIADFWSLALILDELWRLYREISAQSPQAHYARLVDGESPDRKTDPSAAQRFWSEQLSGLQDPMRLLRGTRSGRGDRGAVLNFSLSSSDADRLRALSRQQGVTLFVILAAAFHVLLHRVSHSDDVAFAAPTAGRSDAASADVIGYFANLVVLRADLSDNPTFAALLHRVRASVLAALHHGEVPLQATTTQTASQAAPLRWLPVEATLALPRAQSHLPPSLSALALDWPDTIVDLSGTTLETIQLPPPTPPFGFMMAMAECDGGLLGSVTFDVDLFDSDTIRQLVAGFQRLLVQIAADPMRRIGAIPVFPETEALLGPAEPSLPIAMRCLDKAFDSCAAVRADAIALVSGDEQVTYDSLRIRSNRLARHLRRLGAGPERLIGICLEPSGELVTAILAVLKIGAAYVPLIPSDPAQRLDAIIADVDIDIVVTTGRSAAALRARCQVVALDSDAAVIAAEAAAAPQSGAVPDNLAYVLFTSGSTGRPKGVPITHRNVFRLISSTEDWLLAGPEDVWTLFHSYAFDFSVWEIFGALLHGGRLVIVPALSARAPESFARLLADERVTVLNQTPSSFARLLSAVTRGLAVPATRHLRMVIFGGEALSLDRLTPLLKTFPEGGPQLVNMYGITETTVHVTRHFLTYSCLRAGGRSPIGAPLDDMTLVVLDPCGMAIGPSLVGDLCVGGEGLSRGYLKQPGLTADRFRPDPFSRRPGGRVYRSGDLVRRLANGKLEFVGRRDQQVKVRGYRVELGEIEAALREHPAIIDASVALRRERFDRQGSAIEAVGERLTAHVVVRSVLAPGASDLREHLRKRLPDYMIPAEFVVVDEFPLTRNGKIDKDQLLRLAGPLQEEAPERPAEPSSLVDRLTLIWGAVLGRKPVSLDDDFFNIGGDSIRALQIVGQARAIGLQTSVEHLYRTRTIRRLVAHADETSTVEQSTLPFFGLAPADRKSLPPTICDAYPLSRLQQMLVFQFAHSADYEVYVTSVRVRAPFNLAALQRALDGVVERHPMLRTSFDLSNYSEPLQLVHEAVAAPIVAEDWRHLERQEQKEKLQQFLARERHNRFEWWTTPLIRIFVHRLSDETFQLSLTEPFLDGWSVSLVIREIFDTYARICATGSSTCEPPRSTFRDFVFLERDAMRSPDGARFWRELLAGVQACTLPRVSHSDSSCSARWRRQRVDLRHETVTQLRTLAAAAQLPLRAMLLAAHVKVTGLIAGTNDVVTGVISHGRLAALEGDRVVGLFLNTLPLRQTLATESWRELAQRIVDAEQAAVPFRRYPLAEIQRLVGPAARIETAFNFTEFHVLGGFRACDQIEIIDWTASDQTYFPLTAQFNVRPDSAELSLALDHDERELGADQAERIGGYYQAALRTLVEGFDRPHAFSELLSPDERKQTLIIPLAAQSPAGASAIVAQFDFVVGQTPDRIALTDDDHQVSYRELCRRAGLLADHLRILGVGPEVPVALLMDRSIASATATLAIMKAAGVCVPLPTSHPEAYMADILEQIRPAVLLVDRAPSDTLRSLARHLVIVPDGLPPGYRRDLAGSRQVPHLDNAAYEIFTSGSTGRPKGIIGMHRGLMNRLKWAWETYPYIADDVCCLKTSIGFVDSIAEFWAPLLKGVRLVVLSDPIMRDVAAFAAAVARLRVSHVVLVPSLLARVLELPVGLLQGLGSVRQWNVSGENLSRSLARRFAEAMPGARMLNIYGSSEVAADVTCQAVTDDDSVSRVPIGRAISGATVLICDEHLMLRPVGVKGTIHVGGEPLARGYLGDPALTAAKFLPDPFAAIPGGRQFQTGDIGCLSGNRVIEYLGRLDRQVKVRGVRVEPQEIEALLAEQGGVREAAVVVRGEGAQASLIAYVRLQDRQDVSLAALSETLKSRLPSQLVPLLLRVDRFPHTASGKIDYQALPPPASADVRALATAEWQPARGQPEEIIKGIWEDALQVEEVGVHDNFVQLGGHSLLAAQVVSRVRNVFGVDIPLHAFIEAPTVAGLASVIERHLRQWSIGNPGGSASPISPRPGRTGGPLSHAQRGLWVVNQLLPTGAIYNVHVTVLFQGKLDLTALAQSLQAVIDRHEILRCFVRGSQAPEVVVLPAHHNELPVLELGSVPPGSNRTKLLNQAVAHARMPFDLGSAPLLRTAVTRMNSGECALHVTMDHIISDEWSLGVMLREVQHHYAFITGGRPPNLPAPPIQYGDFVEWQQAHLSDGRMASLLRYWTSKLAGLPVSELPHDHARPAIKTYVGETARFEIDPVVSGAVRKVARASASTVFVTLLSAFKVLMYSYTRQPDVVVGTDVAGRTREELEPLIGLFVNQLVLRTDLSGNPGFDDVLARVRRTTLEALAHQDLPFDRLVHALSPIRDRARTPLFQVKFVMHNVPMPKWTQPELCMNVVPVDTGFAKFDLLINLWDHDHAVIGSVEYDTSLYERRTIEDLIARYKAVLEAVTQDQRLSVQQVSRTIPQRTEAIERPSGSRRPRSAVLRPVAMEYRPPEGCT